MRTVEMLMMLTTRCTTSALAVMTFWRLSGLAHHLLPRGDLNLVVIVIAAAVDALHDGAAHLLRVAAIAITLLAKMIAEIATGTMIVTVAVIGTDHAVPTHGTVTVTWKMIAMIETVAKMAPTVMIERV
jgi:hypothetical protein